MKRYLILFLVALPLICCEDHNNPAGEQETVYIGFTPAEITRAVTGADDLPEEYEIRNLSIFLADPGSNVIANRFVHQPFSSVDPATEMNYKQVALPLDPAGIGRKDVYVVANCPDIASLDAVTSLDGLRALQTPEATVTEGLSAATAGLPMYGESPDMNLATTSAGNPALVTLKRTCAKLRITLTFTDDSWVGTDNAYSVENVAPYTFYANNTPSSFVPGDMISYPRTAFSSVDAQQFESVAYIYESSLPPYIRIHTNLGGEAKEYFINTGLPVPVRNNLYDIEIQIYPPETTGTRSAGGRISVSADGFKVSYSVKEEDC